MKTLWTFWTLGQLYALNPKVKIVVFETECSG